MNIDLFDFFTNPQNPKQRQYEAVKSIIVEGLSYNEAASRFQFQKSYLYSLVRDAKSGKIILFPEIEKGPKQRRVPIAFIKRILHYRSQDNMSSKDIAILLNEEIKISERTIERILKENGYFKLKRRTNIERGVTKKGTEISLRSESIDFEELKPFQTDCPVAGLYFFLPYILDSGIIDIIKKCKLPESSSINNIEACMSMLALKLIGHERLSTIKNYDHEQGFGVFVGLNYLPKPTYMGTYSCRTSEEMLLTFQEELMKNFNNSTPQLYDGEYINLDFHSIPHYGNESTMEKIWCGSRHKSMKAANTVIAQDAINKTIIYTRADILRKEESNEVKKFVSYWKKIKGKINETLVFDCKFTTYKVLNDLNKEDIHFITLQKRNKKLIEDIDSIPEKKWTKVFINIPKRKHKRVLVHERSVLLSNCTKKFRQIIVTNTGRKKPTVILTNNKNLDIKKVLEVYARRWRVENKLSEIVSFFNLNALSSPLMVRIHFDILWTFIADTLYKRFIKDLRRFENHDSKTIFNKFINVPGKVYYDGNNFEIKIRKRAHTPILKGVDKLIDPISIPWLENRKIKIVWTA